MSYDNVRVTMSKDHKLNTPAKGNYGLGNTTGLAFQLSNKKLSSSESIFDKETNVGSKSSLKKSISHDDKNHKIKIKTVFNLPNNSHGGSSVSQEFYDPFNPTEDDVEHEKLSSAPVEKTDDVYDPFNPTYSDESETDPKSPPNVEVPSPEPFQDQEENEESRTENLSITEAFGTFSKPQEASPPPENVLDKDKMDVDDIGKAAKSPTSDQPSSSPLKEGENDEDSNKYKWAEDVLTKITSTVNKTEQEPKVEEDVDIFADEDSKKEDVESIEASSITGKVKLPSFKLGQDSSDVPPVKFKKLSKKPKVSVSDDKEEFDEEESVLPALTVKSAKSKGGEGKGSKHKDKDGHKSMKRKHSKDQKRSPSPSNKKKNRHRSKSPRRNRHSRSRSKSVKRKRRSRSNSKSRSPRRRRRSTRSRSIHRRRKRSASRSPRRRRSRSRSTVKQRRWSRRSSSRSRRRSKSRSSSRRRRRSLSKDKKSKRKSQSQRKSESEQISKKDISSENNIVELKPSPEVAELPKLPDVTQELKPSETVEVPKSPVKDALPVSILLAKEAISNDEVENNISEKSMDIENAESVSPEVSRWLPIPETKEEPKVEPEVFHKSFAHDTIDIFNSSPVASSKHDKGKDISVKKSSKRKKKKKKSSRSSSPIASKKESKKKSSTSKEVVDDNLKSENKKISKLENKTDDKAKLLLEKAKSPSPAKEKSAELPLVKEESTKHKKKKLKELEKTNSSDSQRQKTLENLPKEKISQKLKSDAKELELIAERVRSKKSKHKLEIKEIKSEKDTKPTTSSKVITDKSHENEDETKTSKKRKKKKHSSKTEHYSSDEIKSSDKKHKTKKQKKKKKTKHHGRSNDSSDKEDESREENKKSKVKQIAKDEQNTPSDFDEIDAALDSALSSGKKHKKDKKKKKRRASEESIEDLNESLSKPQTLFEDSQSKSLKNDPPAKASDEKYLPEGFEDSPKSGNENYSPQLFEDEPKGDQYDIEDFFPLTKSPVKMDIDQADDVESPVPSPISELAEIMKDPSEDFGGVTRVENDDKANFDDDMFADSPYDPGDKTPEEKFEEVDEHKNTFVEQQHEQSIISDDNTLEKRTNVTSLVDIFDLDNDSIQEPHENNQSEHKDSSILQKHDKEQSPDDVYAHVSTAKDEEKPLQTDNITEESSLHPQLHETNNKEDLEPPSLHPDVKVNLNDNALDLEQESGIQEEHLKEKEQKEDYVAIAIESLDVVENKSIKDENESKKSKSEPQSKSSRSRRRSRSKSKESRRKSRSRRSRSRDKGRNDRSRARRSKSRERRKSHRSKSKERKRSTSRSRDRRRSRSKSRDRRRHDNHSRRRHSRSPRRRHKSRSKTPPRRSKRTPEKRSPRRRSRRKSEKSPSPRRHKSPLLSMESVTLKSLKTKAAEPQQISTISGISSLTNKKDLHSHHHHMDEYPDDVPEVMVSAASTNQTALRTLVDVSTNHKPPPSTSLIQIQTIQEPIKKVESPPSVQEEELSPPPPPPPPPKLPSPKKHVHKVAMNGNEDGKKHEAHKEKETLPDEGKEGENGGVTAILNFIGLNPQEKSAAQNAILSIAELSKRLQLDKIVEGGSEAAAATEDLKPPPAPPILPDEEEVLSPISIDNIESSAVELFNKDKKDKYVQKLKFRDRVVEEAKQAIKPFYEKREINKEEYKDIMKRAVNKICSNEAGSYEVNNVKIRRLIRRYIAKYQERNQKKKEKMRIKLEGKYHSSAPSQPQMDDFDDVPSPPENLDSITIPVTTPTLLKREPRKVVTLPDLPLPPPPPPPKPKYWK